MNAVTEERALLVECYGLMRKIAGSLATMQGGTVEYRNADEMSDAEILTEMRGALIAAELHILPALEHPMIKPMIKMLRR